jgi:hypothetical protein
LITGFLFVVAVQSLTSWYAIHDLDQKLSDYLIEKQCFRGRYLGGLSLLTCDIEGAQLISELPNHTPLCVLELAPQGNQGLVREIATSSGEISVIYSSRKSLVLAAKSELVYDFPAPCLPHSDYNGMVENAITVPSFPVRKEVFVSTPRSTAPDPKIVALLNQVDRNTFQSRFDWLQSTYWTRHSQSSRSDTSSNLPGAIEDIQTLYRSYPGWIVQTQDLNRSGYPNPNIMAFRTGTRYPDQYVVFGAHLDDRMATLNDNSSRAPGGDDNGSGTVAVLELARLISENNYQFEYTLVMAHFTGEEQGLYGSQRMAQAFFQQMAEKVPSTTANNTVIAMYNVDMLAWNQSSGPSVLGLTNSSGRMSPTLLQECIGVFTEYNLGYNWATSTACCSDQQSFQAQGFPSISFFETPTSSVVYTFYHTSNDLVPSSSATGSATSDQTAMFAKAAYACVMTKALILQG